MAALTEHYNQIQDRAGDESTGSGVRLLLTPYRRSRALTLLFGPSLAEAADPPERGRVN